MVRTHQVQSFAHCLVGSQQNALVVILLELPDSLLPLVFVAPTIDSSLLGLDVIFLEGLFDHVQHLRKLRKDNHFGCVFVYFYV